MTRQSLKRVRTPPERHNLTTIKLLPSRMKVKNFVGGIAGKVHSLTREKPESANYRMDMLRIDVLVPCGRWQLSSWQNESTMANI